LRRAAERHGFLYLVDHGIDPALIAGVFAQAHAFFARSDADKDAVHLDRTRHRLGWEPLKAQTLEEGSPPDLKEGFYVGPDVTADDPRVLAGRFGVGPNQWPGDMPEFQATMNAYFTAAASLAADVMGALALALDLPGDYFDDFNRDASCRLRLLHYPPQPANPQPGEKGCGAHTDFGSVTLASGRGGRVAGAGRRDRGMDRRAADRGAYVVNLGDLIARWTNHRSSPTRTG
jgi:isopenicillin N synthase-like dioxygenase